MICFFLDEGDLELMRLATASFSAPTSTTAENENKENRSKNKPYSIKWVDMDSTTIPESHWNELQRPDNANLPPVDRRLRETYAEYFIDHMKQYDVSCVLNAKGAKSSAKGLFTIRLKCSQEGCNRQYHYVQKGCNEFQVKRNDADICHKTKKARQCKGPQRKISTVALSGMLPSEYRVLCESSLNKKLFLNGNLQHAVSESTMNKMRQEGLQKQDFDKDDIMDLLKWKLQEKRDHLASNGDVDIYCRRISLDPFGVSAYSNEQFECVNLLADNADENDIYFYFDGTGSLVRHGGKTVYYYAGVLKSKLDQQDTTEKGRLLASLEFLSGEHDSFNIGLPLKEYKHEYHKKYPNKKWPIKHFCSDFSFAILNAVSNEWNNVKLLTYINLIYKLVNGDIKLSDIEERGIVTFIQLCCGHLSKTHSNDVDKYYPTMIASNKAILKEIFAGIFDISDLEEIRSIWRLLSTLLLSKFVTDDVEAALAKLAQILTKSQEKRKSLQAAENISEDAKTGTDEENCVEKLPDDKHEYKTMYEKSLFYQDFKAISYQGEFDETTGSLNSFHCVEYADVFLKKYISILCFWTCLTQKHRCANSPAECHFKNIKGLVRRRETIIGSVPLKAGRFFRQMKEYSMSTTNAIILQIPRNRCCKRKKQQINQMDSIAKKPRLEGSQSVLGLYQSFPIPPTVDVSAENEVLSAKGTPKGRKLEKRNRNLTVEFQTYVDPNDDDIKFDSVDEVIRIDDPNVQEQWFKRKKPIHSYVNKDNLRKVKTSQLSNILTLQKGTKAQKSSLSKLKNCLVDNPDLYLQPGENFVVACSGRKLLYKDEYSSLHGNQALAKNLINFVFHIFEHEHNKVQFETENVETIIVEKNSNKNILKVKKQIFIGTTLQDNKFSLIIVNVNVKQFSYIDPCDSGFDSSACFNNFLQFIQVHNQKYKKNPLPTAEWEHVQMVHQVDTDSNNSGVIILSYVKQYLSSKKIDNFDADKFRVELKHTILRKSSKMTSKCVKCGGHINEDSIKCVVCKRCTHRQCITGENAYACIVCNTKNDGQSN